MYSMGHENRRKLGKMGRDHVMKNYSFENFQRYWVELMDEVTEQGSWSSRSGYNGIRFKEIA